MPSLAIAAWVPGNDSGTYTSPVDKLLTHTTEGGSIEGAVAAYRANNSWPHATVDARYGHPYRIVHHLDFGVPARALRNETGGVQTNRDGVIQFEVVGYATRPSEIDWAWLGANVFGPAARLMGIPIESTVTWVAYPASYGKSAAQRLSAAAWTGYRGFLGHQHVPENSHGDPGAIPIGTVLAAAGATTPVTKEWDEMATREEIAAECRAACEAALTRALTVRGTDVREAVRDLAALGAGDVGVARIARTEDARWWIVTPLGRRHTRSRTACRWLVKAGLAAADGWDKDGDPVPFAVPEADLADIPIIAADDEASTGAG